VRGCPWLGSLGQQCVECFALVEAERIDVDQADHIRRVGAQRRYDLAAIGVSGDDRRAVLKFQELT
jgi:hypothetical protein